MKDLLEIMGKVALFVVVGMLASSPISLMMYLAIERGSWLLGVLAFFLLIAIVSIAVVIQERLEAE